MHPTADRDQEEARLSEIRLLDMAALQPKIDRLTRLAKIAAEVPLAYVAVVEADHAWQSAFEGKPAGVVPRNEAIASLIIAAGQTVFTPDARYFARHHSWVEGPPFVRFFCGAPVRLRNGVAIGAFCISSPEPREPDPVLVGLVEDLAALVSDEIENLRTNRHLAEAESEAQALQRQLQSFVLSSPVALAMTDRDLRLMEVSPRWRIETGLQGEVIGRSIPELFPQMYPALKPWLRKVLAGESLSAEKLLLTRPDGVKRWNRAELGPWRNAQGEVGGIVIMTSDITDMVTSLERAESSEKRLRLAMEIAGLMAYEADYRRGTFDVAGAHDVFMERTATFAEIAADPWATIHPDDREAAKALWRSRLATGQPFRTEYRMNRSDGKEVWAFAAAEMIRDERGEPQRLIGVLKDITARRASEKAVVAARDAAQAANQAKSDFLANMSHEIRTPLNGILGVATALSHTGLTPQQLEMVRLIETSAGTLETILSDVLDLSRIEAGHLRLRPERFDLESCLRSAAALFEPGALDKGLALQVEVALEAAGVFEGDEGRIRQIVFNLLSNAVKFTTHGTVAVRALATENAGDTTGVAISVSDTGVGFDDAVKARLFERFEQADNSITRRFGGSGLGLAISRSLARAMGGDLDAVSEPDRGSTFTLSLPLRRAAEPEKAQPQSAAPLALDRTPRVLLAEDHAVNRRVVELIFGGAGVDLVCVENGREAVEAARRGGFDLILMDMQMPEMDGLTAIRAIRAHERRKRLPRTHIWTLSANALPEHVEASIAAGANGHLAKPISAPALFKVMNEACGTAPSAADLARTA
jgi:PAS domain S-box-containing protein